MNKLMSGAQGSQEGPRVAALYIDPRGPYPMILGPEMCWDESRDARRYDGPWPVVAHPPCGPWSALRHLSHAGEGVRALGRVAIAQVRTFGGVLEQPAGSRLFAHMGVGRSELVEVEQVAWGHPARKRTWLYFVGVRLDAVLTTMRTGGRVTHWCSGVHTKGARGETPAGIKVCSAQQRRRTPIAFAEWLVSLAATASPR